MPVVEWLAADRHRLSACASLPAGRVQMDFFRKEHAHCLSDVMSFFAQDVRLLM